MQRQIILASTSPRREQLLRLLKVKFKAVDSGYEEKIDPKISGHKLVQKLALGKAKAAAKKYPKAIIIAADTLVLFKGKAIGKPKDKSDAFKMLKSFSGKRQIIYSGLTILDAKSGRKFIGYGSSRIYFRELSDKEIKQYVATGEPMDRAGAYAFQALGFNLIAKMEGDITNAIGMPMALLYNALKQFKIKF